MNQQITIFSVTLALLSVSCVSSLTAQITETKFLASDGKSYDYFGRSVCVSGDYAIVGAPLDIYDGEGVGFAHIFHFDGLNWVEQTKLIASDGDNKDQFGWSVSLSGNYALIGAKSDKIGAKGGAGSAYIFHLEGSNWVERAKLKGDSTSSPFACYFGYSVSLSGDYALVGARDDDDLGYASGSAYVFRNDGSEWVKQAKLRASDGDFFERFGSDVSILGDYVLVGTQDGDAAYIFHYDGSDWVEQTKLTAGDGSDSFGCGVSLSGDYAIIGAHSEGDDITGAAYIFHRDGQNWVEEAKLIASDRAPYDGFGVSVSLSGNYALVGANAPYRKGAAYIFRKEGSNWVEQTKLTASDGADEDQFGAFVSLSSNYALVGAYEADSGGTEAGTAYIYSATPLCSKVSQFQARCRPGGVIKARVTMTDASHEGDIIEVSIDDVPYEVTIDPTGRGQLSQGGFSSGFHTVELTNPGQCFDPIVVTCRTSLDEEGNGDWDDELVSESPAETALLGNYPNPFNPSTTIRYVLSADGPVSVRVYNMLGQEVATLVDGFQKAGEQSVTWHGTNNFGQSVASGLYIYRLQAGNLTLSQKMLFAK